MSAPFYEEDEDGFLDTSYSRSRTLAKQRELALNRRNEALGGTNLARSTEGLSKNSAYKTPSITQFSAPRSVESETKQSFFKNEEEIEKMVEHIDLPKSTEPSRSAFDEFEDEEEHPSVPRSNQQPKKSKKKSSKKSSKKNQRELVAYSTAEEMLGSPSASELINEKEEEDEEENNRRSTRPSKRRKEAKASKKKGRKEAKRLSLDDLKDSDDEEEEEDETKVTFEDELKEEDYQDEEDMLEELEMGTEDFYEDDLHFGSKSPESSSSSSSRTRSNPHPALDFTDMHSLVTKPLPQRAGTVQCYIIRRRDESATRVFPVYELYTQDGDLFLLTAKRRKGNKTSNYLISMTRGDLDRHSPSYLGKVRSNFMGTEYHIYDDGVREEDVDPHDRRSHVRCELGVITYASNLLRPKAPRRMNVGIPAVVSVSGKESEDLMVEPWEETHGSQNLMSALKGGVWKDAKRSQSSHEALSEFVNKHPRWNPSVGAYVLNFNGRVTAASVKNFQLVDPEEGETVCLQFGRVGEDEFTMDFSHPFSPLQAFAICLSSFDSKIACD